MPEETALTNMAEGEEGGKTGRYLVLFSDDAPPDAIEKMTKAAGMRMAHAVEFAEMGVNVKGVLKEADVLYLDELHLAIMQAPPSQVDFLSVSAAAARAVVAVEPERFVFALQDMQSEYLRGYRDATANLYERLSQAPGTQPDVVEALRTPRWSDTATLTWGLAATRANRSRFTGAAVKVAVLDTGLDFNHPDFAGRSLTQASFVPGETPQDGAGHGTHCIGTSCGAASPAGTRRRYGISSGASVFVGKVLSNGGSGTDGGILAGIDWAVRNTCRVVSMSLGRKALPGEPFSTVYETAARRALDRGTLIVAAAGNDSNRPSVISPVGHPANCPSIMAVAAVDNFGEVAFFSNRGGSAAGGQVDIAGPGVSVYSSWPLPRRYNTISGTSMATPHVAGIAAQYVEENAAISARDLWALLQRRALRLPAPAVDVGVGLVQSV